MPRALFQKTGNAVYISHLDLMRLFQRAFKRAGLALTHTQGYNPRPAVSIALPLSVGVESCCELLDFDLDGDAVSCEEIMDRLNSALVEGVRVLKVYDRCDKIRNIALLDCAVYLEYDKSVPKDAEEKMSALFAQPSLMLDKRNKNGITQQDIIPLIRSLRVVGQDVHTLRIDARICCQNPTLNPMQIASAVERYLPELKPDFAHCCRQEIYHLDESIFR